MRRLGARWKSLERNLGRLCRRRQKQNAQDNSKTGETLTGEIRVDFIVPI